jgi:hypothetical protein
MSAAEQIEVNEENKKMSFEVVIDPKAYARQVVETRFLIVIDRTRHKEADRK